MRFAAIALITAALAGCANYKPVPEGYAGPVATISDSGIAEDGSKAQMFVVDQVDGNRIWNSFNASAQASSGQGFRLNARFIDRKVPAKPMKIGLKASHTTGAPIQALLSQAAGTFFSVEGVVDFSPKPNGRYVVKGELKKEGSSVWIEDVETKQAVTERVTKK